MSTLTEHRRWALPTRGFYWRVALGVYTNGTDLLTENSLDMMTPGQWAVWLEQHPPIQHRTRPCLRPSGTARIAQMYGVTVEEVEAAERQAQDRPLTTFQKGVA